MHGIAVDARSNVRLSYSCMHNDMFCGVTKIECVELLDRESQEGQNGANLSSVTPSSEELRALKEILSVLMVPTVWPTERPH